MSLNLQEFNEIKEALNLSANAKVERLFGRELITNNSVAVFELVKNSFDAGATRVDLFFNNFTIPDGFPVDTPVKNDSQKNISTESSSIVIKDNGTGMTFDEVKDIWMELGTPSKEKVSIKNYRIRTGQIEKVVTRKMNGEKGIGRFGIDKLGSYATIQTRSLETNEVTNFEIDFSEYDDHSKKLEEIPIYSTSHINPDLEDFGFEIEISHLREGWKAKDLSKIIQDLKMFLSPIPIENDDFKIYIHGIDTNKYPNGILIRNTTFDIIDTYIDAQLTKTGIYSAKIHTKDNVFTSDYNDTKLYGRSSQIGHARIRIYYLDKTNKTRFTKSMGMRTFEFGNIKVFKDHFRIMPYGSPNNDWLKVDQKHAQQIFRTFGTRDIIGYIFLYNEKENKLVEATNRIGFIEDTIAYEDLKTFAWQAINDLQETMFTEVIKKEKASLGVLKDQQASFKTNFSDHMNHVISQVRSDKSLELDLKDTLIDNLNSIKKSTISEIRQHEKSREEIEKAATQIEHLVGKEKYLAHIIHTIKNKTFAFDINLRSKFPTVFSKKNKREPVNLQYRSLTNLVDSAIYAVKGTEEASMRLSVLGYFNELKLMYSEVFEAENINFYLESDKGLETAIILVKKSQLQIVFENLINNSMKFLKETASKDERNICIKLKRNNNKLNIFFMDDGTGISPEMRPHIFTLFSSDPSRNGTGMGLPTSKFILEKMKGSIYLVEKPDDFYTTIFKIELPLF